MFEKLVATFIYLSLWFYGAAQLSIAKDPETCSYGLKDFTGNWIVQPIYSYIQPTSNSKYLVTDIDKVGVLHPNGAVSIPVEFDEIRPGNTYYLVRKGKFWSIIDWGEKQLFEFKYTSVTYDDHGRFYLYITSGKTTSTTVTNLSGQVLISEFTGTITPFKERSVTPFIGLADKNQVKRYGLVDISGKILRQPEFLNVEICYNNFMVSTEKGQGYISFDNKVLLEPKYFVKTPDYSNSNCLSEHYQYEIYEGNKAGLLSGKFKILVKPRYDQMERIMTYSASDSATFLIKRNSKWGLLSSSGRESVPCIYDTIYARSQGKSNYPSNLVTGFYFCVKGNRTELRNDRNELIVPESFDAFDLYYRNNEKFWMLIDGNEMTVYEWGSQKVSKVPLSDKIDSIYIFRFNDKFIPFTLRNENHKMVLKSVEGLLRESENHYFLTLTNSNYEYATYIFTRTGKHIPQKGLRHIELISNTPLALLRYKVGMRLWNTRTGKALTDTIYGEFQHSYATKNLIWARDFTYKTNTYGDWHALDTNGQLRSKESFKTYFFPGKIQTAVESNGKTGIIDTSFKWIVNPIYQSSQVLTDNNFAVQSEGGKWGIATKEGLIIDTLYSTFELLHLSCDGQNYSQNASEFACILTNDNEELFLNSSGLKLTNKAKIKNEQLNCFFSDANCSGKPSAYVPSDRKQEFLETVFPEVIYDTLTKLTANNPNIRVANGNSGYQNSFPVSDFGKHYCSVGLQDYADRSLELDVGFFRGQQRFQRNSFFVNYISDGKNVKVFLLESLFGSEEQKTRMIRTAMKRTLSEQECLSPVLPGISFYRLTKEGIVIKFDNYREVLLTISDLEKESTIWIVNYLR